jgi:hypothetical protein
MTTAKIIGAVIRAVPHALPYLTPETWAVFRAAGGFDGIRNTYWAIVYDAVYDYLTSNQPVTSFRNAMKKGMVDAFVQAAELGYEDAGGELPMDSETLAWLGDAQSSELGNIDNLFSRLKQEWDGLDPINEAFARADNYSKTLDAIYTQFKMWGDKNQMLEWVLGATEVHCDTCAELSGQKHKATWYLSHDYIPRKPGASMDCNGYNCDCSLIDKDGNEVTI